MLYSAWAERGEAEETLQGHTESYGKFHQAAVFPSKVSIDSVKTNGVSYAEWYKSAVALAARGDKAFNDESPTAFKERLQAEVRRMASLEGGVDGKISASTFLFGFEQYLGEGGVLPQSADVSRLAVQLDTIARVVDIFADAGILEVKSIKRIDEKTDDEEDASAAKKKKAKAKKAADEDEDAPKETCLKYAFDFTTRPAALVEVLNKLTACERFATVKNLAFKQTGDMIVDRLSAIANAEAQKAAGSRAATGSRRRRGGVAVATAATSDAKAKADPLIVDPELDAPFAVSFILEVRDFGRAVKNDAAPEAAAPAETEKPAEKKEDQA